MSFEALVKIDNLVMYLDQHGHFGVTSVVNILVTECANFCLFLPVIFKQSQISNFEWSLWENVDLCINIYENLLQPWFYLKNGNGHYLV